MEPGDTYLYKFTVTRPGIYWYHPHHHSSTNQVFKGMYGSIIVTDPDEESLQGTVLPSAADTRTMVLSDLTVCKAVGDNDDDTFPDTMPHVSGTLDPNSPGPTPDDICELDAARRGRESARTVRRRRSAQHPEAGPAGPGAASMKDKRS